MAISAISAQDAREEGVDQLAPPACVRTSARLWLLSIRSPAFWPIEPITRPPRKSPALQPSSAAALQPHGEAERAAQAAAAARRAGSRRRSARRRGRAGASSANAAAASAAAAATAEQQRPPALVGERADRLGPADRRSQDSVAAARRRRPRAARRRRRATAPAMPFAAPRALGQLRGDRGDAGEHQAGRRRSERRARPSPRPAGRARSARARRARRAPRRRRRRRSARRRAARGGRPRRRAPARCGRAPPRRGCAARRAACSSAPTTVARACCRCARRSGRRSCRAPARGPYSAVKVGLPSIVAANVRALGGGRVEALEARRGQDQRTPATSEDADGKQHPVAPQRAAGPASPVPVSAVIARPPRGGRLRRASSSSP